MLNRKRSRKLKLAAYTLLLPVAFAFVLANSAEAIARAPGALGTMLQDAQSFKQSAAVHIQLPEVVVVGYAPSGATPNLAAEEKMRQFKRTPTPQSEIKPEVVAQYPGGEEGLLRFIAQNIKYPVIALENGIEGMVEIQFTVEPSGNVIQLEILQGIDPSLDMEVLRVFGKMPKWSAATLKGQAQSAHYTLPVRYRLDYTKKGNDRTDSEGDTYEMIGGRRVYTQTSEMPQFEGGEQQLLMYIARSVKYPPEAAEKKEQGLVVVEFIVETDGSISGVAIRKGITPLLDKEALRVVNTMSSRWTAGKHNGEKVPILFRIPVNFRLQ